MDHASALNQASPSGDNDGGDILVVDDNAANLVAIEAALGSLSGRVMRAQSGSEALRLMLDRDFALVLLDVNMPSMGGFETARVIRARKRSSHTPIIFITAYGRDDREVRAAYELGAVDFLFKPIVPEVLIAKAAVFVELQRRAAEVARQAEQIREHERREHERALEEERHRWQEQALRREMDQMAETDRKKDQFLAVLAHELRTPLSPIVTGLELLGEKLAELGTSDGSFLRIRDTMARQAKHLTRLVDDLLDISRISSGKIELHLEALDLRDIVTQAIAACGPLLDERDHHVTVDPGSTPLPMHGDEVRLVQVVANLLNNAARYSNAGGPIEVSCSRNGGNAELRVRDRGYGISPELLPHIFEVFVQERPSRGEGLGLGLSVVAKLVGLHGGTVSAHSEGQGCGSEFIVRLPLDATQTARAPAVNGEAGAGARAAGNHPLRVVLVEDNADIREMLGDLLALWHHQVQMAEDGESGAALAIAARPDVALIDIGLPMLDGYGVAARIRAALGTSITLVAMTGYGQEADKERALAAGFDVHLVKPVAAEDLKQVLSKLSAIEERDAGRNKHPQEQQEQAQTAQPQR